MKKIQIIIVIVFSAFIAHSQDKQHPPMEEHLKRSQEMLQKELQMTAGQQKKVGQAYKEFMVQAEKLHKEKPPPPLMDPKIKAEFDKLIAQRDDKVKMALTADQYKKYVEVEKKIRPPHPPFDDKSSAPPFRP